MIRRSLIAFALMLFMAPALANQCPGLMNDIDEALEDDAVTSELDEGELERVRELRQEGEDHHNEGNHEESEEALNEAKEILGV